MMEGTRVQIRANAVVMATGGAGRVYRYNTNGGIVTGDGMGMAFHHGVPLRDMEFVQYHPTGLPGSGILMTEGCRGEGGIPVNKDGYRYLQDYGMGRKPHWASRRTNTWSWARATKCPVPSGTNGAPAALSPPARRRGLSRSAPRARKAAGAAAVHLRTGQGLRRRRPGERSDPGAPYRTLHHGRH